MKYTYLKGNFGNCHDANEFWPLSVLHIRRVVGAMMQGLAEKKKKEIENVDSKMLAWN